MWCSHAGPDLSRWLLVAMACGAANDYLLSVLETGQFLDRPERLREMRDAVAALDIPPLSTPEERTILSPYDQFCGARRLWNEQARRRIVADCESVLGGDARPARSLIGEFFRLSNEAHWRFETRYVEPLPSSL